MSTSDLTEQQKRMRARGICVIIPTYNNDGTVADVARKARQECADVYVVADGCTDHTLECLAEVEGITVISYKRNRGKGYAIKAGFRRARRDGFAYAITLDADAQHLPSDIPLFLEANIRWPGAIIVGNRKMKGVDRSAGSTFANKFSNFWFWVQTWRKGVDTQSGFRLYPIYRMPPRWMITNRYESELEMLVIPAWNGTRIRTVDINVYYPERSQRVSHFRPVVDFTRISILNSVLCLGAGIYGLPRLISRNLAIVAHTVFMALFTLVFVVLGVNPMVALWFSVGHTTDGRVMRLHRFMRWCARFIMMYLHLPGVKFYHYQASNRWDEKPSVVICNHQSHFDLLCMLVFSPRMVFVTNRWVWRSPIFGAMIHRAGYLNATDGIETLLPRMRELVDKGYSIAIFPEGHRSKDCTIQRFHKGAFHVAKELGIGITPMCLYGPGKVWPKGGFLLRRGRIRIDVGRPISRDELDGMGDVSTQTRTMRRRYIAWYRRMCDKMERKA